MGPVLSMIVGLPRDPPEDSSMACVVSHVTMLRLGSGNLSLGTARSRLRVIWRVCMRERKTCGHFCYSNLEVNTAVAPLRSHRAQWMDVSFDRSKLNFGSKRYDYQYKLSLFFTRREVGARAQRENFVTYQATYTLAGPPDLRWGNLKGMSAWE